MGFRKILSKRSFSLSLQPNQQGREQDWVYSLAYDIIKAHGGEIKVETKEGEGSGVHYSIALK